MSEATEDIGILFYKRSSAGGVCMELLFIKIESYICGEFFSVQDFFHVMCVRCSVCVDCSCCILTVLDESTSDFDTDDVHGGP